MSPYLDDAIQTGACTKFHFRAGSVCQQAGTVTQRRAAFSMARGKNAPTGVRAIYRREYLLVRESIPQLAGIYLSFSTTLAIQRAAITSPTMKSAITVRTSLLLTNGDSRTASSKEDVKNSPKVGWRYVERRLSPLAINRRSRCGSIRGCPVLSTGTVWRDVGVNQAKTGRRRRRATCLRIADRSASPPAKQASRCYGSRVHFARSLQDR